MNLDTLTALAQAAVPMTKSEADEFCHPELGLFQP